MVNELNMQPTSHFTTLRGMKRWGPGGNALQKTCGDRGTTQRNRKHGPGSRLAGVGWTRRANQMPPLSNWLVRKEGAQKETLDSGQSGQSGRVLQDPSSPGRETSARHGAIGHSPANVALHSHSHSHSPTGMQSFVVEDGKTGQREQQAPEPQTRKSSETR